MTAVPAPVLVLGAIISVQFGGALAAALIPLIGVTGSVTLRLILGVVILTALARPRLRGRSRADWATVVAFGLALAAMNTSFYGALARLPIGVAVTLEFVGPLLLSAALSRRARDLAAVVGAAVGVVLISNVLAGYRPTATVPAAATTGGTAGGSALTNAVDPVGIGLALLAGAMWAAYIVLSGRTGARFARLDGLTIAMMIAALVVAPFGLVHTGSALLDSGVLLTGLGIALLSSVLPYSLELLALRRMDAQIFGIMLSLEPAVAAVAGFLVLRQRLTVVQLFGMGLVVLASVVVTRERGRRHGARHEPDVADVG